MNPLTEKREAVRVALEAMEAAHRAIDQAGEDADLDVLAAAFDEAEARHGQAVKALKRAEMVAEARAAAPVEPVVAAEETVTEAREADVKVTKEPLTYEKHSPHSVFRDLARADRGDGAAQQRLERHKAEMRVEKRDLSSTDSAGGYLVAPLWLQNEFVDFARAGRVAANAIGSKPLPPDTDSINLPTMDGGTAVGVQSDGGAVSETDATFNTVSAAVGTIAGMQDVSRQLLDRSVPGIDAVIFADLAKAYNVKLDSEVLGGTTTNRKGITEVASTGSVTYTDASPTVGELYPKVADAIQKVHTSIYMAPDAVLMHPRRWAWILGAVDGSNRPLVTPYAPQNAAGDHGGVVAEGLVGSIQGLPVFVDPNIVTTAGAGTNEDEIYVVRRDELFLWEDQSGPFLETFPDVGSGTLTVRFRLHNYWTQCFSRRPGAISVISGTGLVNPF